MQAFIFGLMIPVLPFLVRQLYCKEERLTVRQLGGRYVIYTLLMTGFGTFVMAFGCDRTSFLAKMDQVPSFALKFACIELGAAAVIAAAEWVIHTKKISITVDGAGYSRLGVVRFCRKVLFPGGCFLLALVVVCLNFSLMNDNVVWGDEAYSGNTVQHSVEGIFQILTLEENHPPLYYLWLKGFAELFGYKTPVYHLASLAVFLIGIVLALMWMRRHYGNIPTAFFIVISGLAAPCLEYNLEIRMYALAFLGIAGCYYSVSRIMEGSKAAGWIGMVFWALVAAYAHYYALVVAGVMIFFTCVLAYLRYRGKVWLKGVVSIAVCIAAYAPWLGQVLRATKSVSGNWWMTEIESLGQCLTMIGCGESMEKIVLPLLILLALILFLWESSVFCVSKRVGVEETGQSGAGQRIAAEETGRSDASQRIGVEETGQSGAGQRIGAGETGRSDASQRIGAEETGRSDASQRIGARETGQLCASQRIAAEEADGTSYQIRIVPPSMDNWSAGTYTLAVGFLTILCTVIFAYGISVIMQPLVTGRYLYPLCAVVAIMLAVSAHDVLEHLGRLEKQYHLKWLQGGGKGIFLAVLAVLFVIGMGNYKEYRAVVKYEDAKTAEILSIIGETDEDTQFINNGITHIGWTVLRYYYPDRDIVNGSFEEASGRKVWYFTNGTLSEEQMRQVNELGYGVAGYYGDVQLGKYECMLYYFERIEPEAKGNL